MAPPEAPLVAPQQLMLRVPSEASRPEKKHEEKKKEEEEETSAKPETDVRSRRRLAAAAICSVLAVLAVALAVPLSLQQAAVPVAP